MKLIREMFDKNIIIDNLSDICISVDKIKNGDGGNCGNFALALAKELYKYYIDCQIVICSNFEIQDDDNIDIYNAGEPDIYHVALLVNNNLYDCTGEINIDMLGDIAYDQYGNSQPDITAWQYTNYNYDLFRKVFEWNTNYNVSVEYFQKLFRKQIDSLLEGEVK